jgi:hypothetical protein
MMIRVWVAAVVSLLATCAGEQSTEPALSRNIAIASDGSVIATSRDKGSLKLQVLGSSTISIGFPRDQIASIDDISISDDGYLFGLSVYNNPPLLCSFRIVTANVIPLGCAPGDYSVTKYTGVSCNSGKCVISGGTGGFTVFDYNRDTGALSSIMRCFKCPAQETDEVDVENPDFVDVEVFDSRRAVLSTLSGAKTLSVILDLITFQMTVSHEVPNPVVEAVAQTPTGYPCVSDFFITETGISYLFTACGSITVQQAFAMNSTVILETPTDLSDYQAITLSVDTTAGKLVVGGTGFSGTLIGSYISVYNIDISDPSSTTLDAVQAVPGQILSVAANVNRIAFVNADNEEIQPIEITPGPTLPPSIAPSMAPTSSINPSVESTFTPSASQAPSKGSARDNNNSSASSKSLVECLVVTVLFFITN